MQVQNISFKSNSHCNTNQQSFLGHKIDILDAGQHMSDLKYFAKTVIDDIKIQTINVETNPQNYLVKQMDSLKQKLVEINAQSKFKRPDYIAIPGSFKVPLLNLNDRINAICHQNIGLTPENIKDNKEALMEFLQIISENPHQHEEQISHMDPLKQGAEHVFAVIQEINKAIKKGIKVYIPSSHPQMGSIQWLAKDKGLKPELYHYLATGEDINGAVSSIQSELKNKNWYDFNLLVLSDAKSVNLQDINGNSHLYSAFDSCISEGARGVYNFSPIRKKEKLIGFSFLDEKTVHYPLKEYGRKDYVSNLTKFVGLPLDKVLASPAEHEKFIGYLHCNTKYNVNDFANKLFNVDKVFSPTEIDEKKIRLMGDYVDSSLNLFFRENKDGNVIFPNCESEQSGRPSVTSMTGSCFSIFNAIKKNIGL